MLAPRAWQEQALPAAAFVPATRGRARALRWLATPAALLTARSCVCRKRWKPERNQGHPWAGAQGPLPALSSPAPHLLPHRKPLEPGVARSALCLTPRAPEFPHASLQATGTMKATGPCFGRIMRQQAVVALLLGTGLAAGGWVRVYLTNGDVANSTAISLSLFLIVVTSVVTGTALPFALARAGVDPANAGTSIQVRDAPRFFL